MAKHTDHFLFPFLPLLKILCHVRFGSSHIFRRKFNCQGEQRKKSNQVFCAVRIVEQFRKISLEWLFEELDGFRFTKGTKVIEFTATQ